MFIACICADVYVTQFWVSTPTPVLYKLYQGYEIVRVIDMITNTCFMSSVKNKFFSNFSINTNNDESWRLMSSYESYALRLIIWWCIWYFHVANGRCHEQYRLE